MNRPPQKLPKPVKLTAMVDGNEPSTSVFLYCKDLWGLPSLIKQTVARRDFHHLEIGTDESVLRFEVVE